MNDSTGATDAADLQAEALERDHALAALEAFAIESGSIELESLRHGHIHRTWLVDIDGQRRYVLQGLNTHVFKRPDLVARNIVAVTRHLESICRERGENPDRRCLRVIPTVEGEPMVVVPTADGGGLPEAALSHWRLFSFVPGSRSLLEAQSADQAFAAARAFARFQLDLAGLEPSELSEPIPHFHDTPIRYAALDRAVATDAFGRGGDCQEDIEKAERWRPLADVLLEPHRRGEIPLRIAHNDAKISNVLFDADRDEGLCVIDLDTVMPGLSLYDFGEMVRSMSSHFPEDSRHPEDLELDLEHLEAMRDGYLELASDLLAPIESTLLLEAGKLLTLENGIRFLTDHLEGDHYYGRRRPGQNLDRCRTQFALLEALDRIRW